MGGGEEEPPIDDYLSRLSIKQLNDKIKNFNKMLLSATLCDGGEKLKIHLKKLEAELERRVALEDLVKSKVNLAADESTCNGVNNDLSSGAPTSNRPSQSAFALHFHSKLDDERGHGDNKSSREELSTWHQCGSKNVRASELVPTDKRQKIDLSSSRVPFKSPNHLSVKSDDRPESECEQLGSHVTTPCHSEARDCFVKKGNAPRVQPSRKCTRNNNTVVLVDEEELEVDATDPKNPMEQSSNKNPIYYPSRDDPEAIEIHYSDMECLAPESYLSSTIMNFYIRYLQRPASPTTRSGCNYHFFNTYFYQKLKQFLSKIDKKTSFPKFRRWWKGVGIFQKAYIFLPINEKLHWSLVIICIPDTEDEAGPVILHLDSLGFHFSRSILSDVKRFLVEEWTFLRQGEEPEPPEIPSKIWNRLSRKIDEKVIEVPQQSNDYDCGLFVLFFIERFIDEAPERLKKEGLEMFDRQWFRPEQASSLRQKIKNLLIEEFRKANADTSKSDA